MAAEIEHPLAETIDASAFSAVDKLRAFVLHVTCVGLSWSVAGTVFTREFQEEHVAWRPGIGSTIDSTAHVATEAETEGLPPPRAVRRFQRPSERRNKVAALSSPVATAVPPCEGKECVDVASEGQLAEEETREEVSARMVGGHAQAGLRLEATAATINGQSTMRSRGSPPLQAP